MIDATLVTIHGFWSSPATWDRLIHVWRADEALRGLQIYPFGYPSPKKPRLPFSVTRVPGFDDIAQTLATAYKTTLADASDIAVVTHSQGGLILIYSGSSRGCIWRTLVIRPCCSSMMLCIIRTDRRAQIRDRAC